MQARKFLFPQIRETPPDWKELPLTVDAASSLAALEEAGGSPSSAVTVIHSAVLASISQPVMKKADVFLAAASSHRSSLKRVLREYVDFQEHPAPGWSVYINTDNMCAGKLF